MPDPVENAENTQPNPPPVPANVEQRITHSANADQRTMQEVGGISLSLRVPPFWRDRPRLWFVSFEAATHDLRRSQSQLSQMVIAQLDKQDVEQISDLLYNPPSENQYQILKERLISVYEESEGRQFQKLLQEMELGEQKPTQLLRRMRNLARDKVPDSTLRLMWMNHLPPHVRSVLVVSDTISKTAALDELALLADKMLEQNHEVSAVSSAAPMPLADASSSHQCANQSHLVEEIRKLTLEVAELRSSRYNNYRPAPFNRSRRRFSSRERHRAPSRSHSRGRRESPSPHCHYHRRFGKDARRCTTPCTFNEDNAKKSEN